MWHGIIIFHEIDPLDVQLMNFSNVAQFFSYLMYSGTPITGKCELSTQNFESSQVWVWSSNSKLKIISSFFEFESSVGLVINNTKKNSKKSKNLKKSNPFEL